MEPVTTPPANTAFGPPGHPSLPTALSTACPSPRTALLESCLASFLLRDDGAAQNVPAP